MNNPVGFEQDPERPEGTGTFRFSDGSELYAMDPGLASSVRSRQSERTAEGNAHAPRAGTGVSQRFDPLRAYEALNAPRADVPAGPAKPLAPGEVPLEIPTSTIPEGGLHAAQPYAGPSRGPSAADRAAFQSFLGGGQAGPAPTEPTPRKPPPRPMVAGRDPMREAMTAVPVPRGTTISVEGTGAPYSQEDAESRADLSTNYNLAKMAEFDVQRARHEREAAMHRASIPALKRREAEQAAAYDNLEAVYKHERAIVREKIAAFDKQAKPDPERYFNNKGTFARIAMIIGQALGAYGAALAGTENFAQKFISERLDADYQAQLDEIKEGRISQGNMLAQLADQLGDLQQAKSALKLVQDEMVDREIKAYAAETKSEDVMVNANTWLAQRAEERLREEQAFRDRSIGKTTTTTTADMVVPRAARAMTDEEIMARQTKQNKARSALLESQNEVGYQQQGGEQAGKLAKRQGEEAGNAELYVEGFGNAKTKNEAIALRSAMAEHENRMQTLDRMSELNEKAATGVPSVGDFGTEEAIEAQQLSSAYSTSIARSYGGPITDSDRKAAKEITPDPTSWFSGNQKVKIRTAREASRNKLNADIRAIVSGKHAELPTERKEGGD